MADIRERQRRRDRVLLAVYELTDGSRVRSAGVQDIAAATGLRVDEVEGARRWLREHGLLDSMSAAGDVSVTANGSDRAELLLSGMEPDRRAVTVSLDERRLLERFVREVRIALDSSGLAGDDLADAEAQLATIEAQMRSPRPRRDVIGGAIRALTWAGKEALSGLVGGGAFAAVFALAG